MLPLSTVMLDKFLRLENMEPSNVVAVLDMVTLVTPVHPLNTVEGIALFMVMLVSPVQLEKA